MSKMDAMKMYNAAVEVARKTRTTDDAVDRAMLQLEQYHVTLSGSSRGWWTARISLPAETLAQATTTACALVEAALGAPAIAAEVMTEEEFDAREGFEPVAEMLGVTETAALLGVSRQAVLDRIHRGTLQATKVGHGWAIPRSAV